MERGQFEQSFLQYERLVYTICFQMVQDHAQAEDLTQETFLAAWIHRDRCTPGAEKAWLCRIATNRAKDYLKSAYRRRVNPEEIFETRDCMQLQEKELSVEEAWESKEAAQGIERRIKGLRSPYREVGALYFLGSYTVPEIARMLQRPDKTVHTQLFRARALLRKGLSSAVA